MSLTAATPAGELGPARRVRWWRRVWLRLALAFVLAAMLPAALAAVYTSRRHLNVVRSVARAGAAASLAALGTRIEDKLAVARSDVLTLTEWPLLETGWQAGAQAATSAPADEFWLEKLEQQLRTFLSLREAYEAVTVVAGDGAATVRVERRGDALVTRAGAQGRPAASQVGHAATLLPRQVGLSVRPAEAGQAARLVLVGRRAAAATERGVLVLLELPASALLGEPDEVRNLVRLEDAAAGLLAEQGGAIGAANSEQTWTEQVQIAPDPARPEWTWTLVGQTPVQALEAGVDDFRVAFSAVIGGSLLLALGLSLWLARQFTTPLRELYEAAQRIGAGDFKVTLRDGSGDEFGALAERMRDLARQVDAAHTEFERRLGEAAERLVHAERLSTIGRTAAAVAHEINNPSGIITLYAQMLMEGAAPGDPRTAKLRTIEEKAREISRIVGELLDYARKPQPERGVCHSETLLRGALDAALLTAAQKPEHAVDVTVRVADDAATFPGDPAQIGRLLRNLVTNALHAMPKGGWIELSAQRMDGEWVELRVRDSGDGIAADQLDKIFEPFYTTKRFGSGAGLGLAISREIAERHGGSLRADSTLGCGTTMILRLPLVPMAGRGAGAAHG